MIFLNESFLAPCISMWHLCCKCQDETVVRRYYINKTVFIWNICILYQTVQFASSMWPQCFLWDLCLKWEVSFEPLGSWVVGCVIIQRQALSGPHYDAAALPMDLPGAKVMVLSQSIQSHDLTYLPNGIWLLRCDWICHTFVHLIVCACFGSW